MGGILLKKDQFIKIPKKNLTNKQSSTPIFSKIPHNISGTRILKKNDLAGPFTSINLLCQNQTEASMKIYQKILKEIEKYLSTKSIEKLPKNVNKFSKLQSSLEE